MASPTTVSSIIHAEAPGVTSVASTTATGTITQPISETLLHRIPRRRTDAVSVPVEIAAATIPSANSPIIQGAANPNPAPINPKPISDARPTEAAGPNRRHTGSSTSANTN